VGGGFCGCFGGWGWMSEVGAFLFNVVLGFWWFVVVGGWCSGWGLFGVFWGLVFLCVLACGLVGGGEWWVVCDGFVFD